MKQRWLPEFDYPDVDGPDSIPETAGVADQDGEATFVEVLPGQRAVVTNRLCASVGMDEPLPAEAAALLRDALLAGFEPAPGDFDDARFADLLAENYGPVWLACLGALRHLWPVPPADSSDLVQMAVESQDDDERGRQFWACLQRTVSCSRGDPAAVAARIRMKQLDPDMHALFMRDGVRRE